MHWYDGCECAYQNGYQQAQVHYDEIYNRLISHNATLDVIDEAYLRGYEAGKQHAAQKSLTEDSV